MRNSAHRLPPEWQQQDAVLLSWPHADTDWRYMLPQVQDCYKRLIGEIAKYARVLIAAPDVTEPKSALKGIADPARILYMQVPTNDTWTRDYGFITTIDDQQNCIVNDFKFNGWGLKFASDRDNMVSCRILHSPLAMPGVQVRNRLNFVLEGGSIEIDEYGTLLTTSECLLSPNRNGGSTKDEIEKYLLEALGGLRILWLDHGYLEGDDTDSHIDTLARFLPGGIIAYTACDRPDDCHYAALKMMEQQLQRFRDHNGQAYRLVPLPIPHPIHDADGLRLPATYANFLLINGALLLPIYNDAHYDGEAMRRIDKAVGNAFEIVPIDCTALIQQHGSLHCATMQIPDGILR